MSFDLNPRFLFLFQFPPKKGHTFFPPYAVLLILWVSLGHDIWASDSAGFHLIGFIDYWLDLIGSLYKCVPSELQLFFWKFTGSYWSSVIFQSINRFLKSWNSEFYSVHVKLTLTGGIIDERFCGCHKGSVSCLSLSCCNFGPGAKNTDPQRKCSRAGKGRASSHVCAVFKSGHSVRTKTDLCDWGGFHTVWPRRTHVHVGENPNPANALLSEGQWMHRSDLELF